MRWCLSFIFDSLQWHQRVLRWHWWGKLWTYTARNNYDTIYSNNCTNEFRNLQRMNSKRLFIIGFALFGLIGMPRIHMSRWRCLLWRSRSMQWQKWLSLWLRWIWLSRYVSLLPLFILHIFCCMIMTTLFYALLFIMVLTDSGVNCRENEFKCDNICYPLSRKCDRITDCRDGSDEQNCRKYSKRLIKILINHKEA